MTDARKLSTTDYPILFLMVDSTDHITGKTGLSPTVTISKNGGAFGAPSGVVSEVASGWYKLAGNAGDRDTLGELAVHATSAGADPCDLKLRVVSYDPFADISAILEDTGTTLDDLLDALVARLTAARAGYLDKLNVSGALAHSDAAATYKADVSALATSVEVSGVAAAVWSYATRTLSSFGTLVSSIWAYATRTLTGFTTTEFNVIGPVRNDGKIDAVAGDDYYAADGRGMAWSDTAWPDLTGATVSFISGSTTIAMTVVTAGTGEQTVNLDVPRATSLAMKGEFKFIIKATLVSTHVVTLLEGEGKFK